MSTTPSGLLCEQLHLQKNTQLIKIEGYCLPLILDNIRSFVSNRNRRKGLYHHLHSRLDATTDVAFIFFLTFAQSYNKMTEDPEYIAVVVSGKTQDDGGSGTEIEMIESGKALEKDQDQHDKHVHPWSCPMLRKFLERIGFHIKTQAQMDAENNAPQLPPWKIFKLFLWFGCRAFGGTTLISSNQLSPNF